MKKACKKRQWQLGGRVPTGFNLAAHPAHQAVKGLSILSLASRYAFSQESLPLNIPPDLGSSGRLLAS